MPPNTPIQASPRTLSIILHTHGPLAGIDDRLMTSSDDVTFTQLLPTAYGTQPPPPPCRGGLIYLSPTVHFGLYGPPPLLNVGADCDPVTYTVRPGE